MPSLPYYKVSHFFQTFQMAKIKDIKFKSYAEVHAVVLEFETQFV